MAVQLDLSGKDDKNDIKTHFVTREGVYRILNLSSEEFAVNPARPRPLGYQSNQSSPQVRVSIVSLPPASLTSEPNNSSNASGVSNETGNTPNGPMPQLDNGNCQGGDRICFNIGKELYVYSFKGLRKVSNDEIVCHCSIHFERSKLSSLKFMRRI